MRYLNVLIIGSFFISQFNGCAPTSRKAEGSIPPQVSVKPTASNDAETEIPFQGCWASYNGKLLQIKGNELRLHWDDQAARAERISESDSKSRTMVHLISRPEYFYFQEFIAIERGTNEFGTEEITITQYRNREDLSANISAGISAWVRDVCK